MQLPTQQQFVADCLAKYRWEPIPADQKWEEAHYPLPECLGGEETVMLWSADHTVQGLLQSVEFDHKCFHSFRNRHDTDLLTSNYPQYLELFQQLTSKFNSRHGKTGGKIGGKKAAITNKANGTGAFFDPKLQSAGGKIGGKKAAATNKSNGTGVYDPEVQSAGAQKTNAQRWQCLVTKHISTPGPLARYQKARGIDTKLRVKITIDGNL